MADAAAASPESVPPMPSGAEMDAIYEAVKNWGRWEDDDDRGALALLTPERRAAAARLVRSGTIVSLARDLLTAGSDDSEPGRHAVQHEMLAHGATRRANDIDGYEASRDFLGTDVHGLGVTHIDALCHMFVRGQMFNGLPAELVTEDGALRNDVLAAGDGIAGRGVLLDVPAARGVSFLEPPDAVTVADLEAAERAQSSQVMAGDLLVVATGRDARRAWLGRDLDPLVDGLVGLHPECLRWLSDRDVALLGSDGVSDPLPAGPVAGWPFPVHQVAITGMGVMLVDNMRLDALLAVCVSHEHWEFLLTLAPLRVPGGTGCPVNPLALL